MASQPPIDLDDDGDDTKSQTSTDDFGDFGDLGNSDDDFDSDFDESFSLDMGDIRRKSVPMAEIQEHLRGRSDEIFFLSESRASTLRSQSSNSSLFDESLSLEPDSPNSELSHSESTPKRRLPSANYLAEVMSGSVKFSYTAFIREWLYNFFHPIGLPIVWMLEGQTGARSRGYWGLQFGLSGVIIGLIYNFVPLTLWILYYTPGIVTSGFVIEFAFMNMLVICRITAVAIKWAYQPEEVFDYMREKTLNPQQQQMLHLLQGWSNVQPMALAREILQSSGRLKMDISHFRFVFRDDNLEVKGQGKKKRKEFRKEIICQCAVSEPTRGDLLVPYLLFVTSRGFSRKVVKKSKFSLVVAIAICMLPTIGRIKSGEILTLTPGAIAFNVLLVAYTIFIFQIQLLFINVVALDFHRRSELQIFCTRLIQPGRNAFSKHLDTESHSYKHHLWPRAYRDNPEKMDEMAFQSIDLTNAETVFYWSQLRRFFMDFGLRWLRREEGLLSLYCVLILTFEVGVIFTFIVLRYAFSPWEFAVAFAAIIVIGIPVTRAMSLGQRINYSRDKQRAILSEKRLKLHKETVLGYGLNEIREDSPLGIKLRRAVLMIDKIMEMLKHGRYTITFLGFRIDVTVTSLVASVLGSLGFTLARALTGSGNTTGL